MWASIPDPRGGNTKLRPIVIVTDTSEIVLDAEIVGVAITTTYPQPPDRRHVELPWARHRHPATGLARRSAAVCDWLVKLRPSQVLEIKGYVPQLALLEVLCRIREFNE